VNAASLMLFICIALGKTKLSGLPVRFPSRFITWFVILKKCCLLVWFIAYCARSIGVCSSNNFVSTVLRLLFVSNSMYSLPASATKLIGRYLSTEEACPLRKKV
jgi:hypothetical protein